MEFGLMSILFAAVFLAVLGVFVYVIVASIRRSSQDRKSPRLTVEATVVSRRAEYRRNAAASGMDTVHAASWTIYYVTFQVESGDRMELQVSGSEYGMLAQGDRGKLTFQGSRFLGFARTGAAIGG